MSRVDIPDDYPKGCSDDLIKKVVVECQNKIAKLNYASNVVLGTTYYTQVAEQGNAELNRRLNEKLISNLEKSSKRQRGLTWSIQRLRQKVSKWDVGRETILFVMALVSTLVAIIALTD